MERRNGLQYLLSLKTVGISVVFLKYDKRIVWILVKKNFAFTELVILVYNAWEFQWPKKL